MDLIIIGASGHGKVVAEIAEINKEYANIYFMDDFSDIKEFHGYRNLGSTKQIDKYKDKADFFVAIGDNSVRKDKLEALIKENYSIPTIIHPDTVISNTAYIGKGTVVMAGAIINASVKVNIGTIINTNSSIDHDSTVGKYTHISPGTTIAGSVSIGDEVWIGINASVINNITICDNVVVGAGSLVLENIEKCGTYVGIPVRKIH